MHIVWFKRDLRSFDHRPLSNAAAQGPVLPLYVVEPGLWRQATMSARHFAFISESILELQDDLARLGQPLVIRTGDIIDVFEILRQTHGVTHLWSHQETGDAWTFARDQQIADWCKAHGIVWQEERQHGITRRLKSRDGWAKRWDRLMSEPITSQPLLAPIHVDLGTMPSPKDCGLSVDPCLLRQTGGREAGLATLQSFLNERGEPYQRAMSSPIAGSVACSRLSPHLAYGTLALREVTQALWQRMADLKASPKGKWRASMRSFNGRLHWHCHFMQKLEDEPALEFQNLHKAYDNLRPKPGNLDHCLAFEKGETGFPFVDACMRSLQATGWINFRMRAMLMAVASYHLWLDWRRPGEHLARLFTDYEPGIHWPQVQMQSGTTGMNTIRIYNPVKQGKDQDPKGQFIRQWLPELAHIPDENIHEPWLWEDAMRVLGKTYPEPIVDHLIAAKHARERVWGVRRGKPFAQNAAKLQTKHGSRKSGIPNRGQRPKKTAQLSLLIDP